MTEDRVLRVRDYLKHMHEAARRIVQYVASVSQADFAASTLIQDAVIRNFEVIGEAARNIEAADQTFVHLNPEIAWTAIQGMRHRLAHGYYKVNLDVVWVTAKRDVPQLIAAIERLKS